MESCRAFSGLKVSQPTVITGSFPNAETTFVNAEVFGFGIMDLNDEREEEDDEEEDDKV